ncbi:putative MFS-type transporter [Lachnellula suecica]|uniref:Putative MFS-type transporter n=1 Tax=Lachnellula suecica TaxID=602035 RepID=A0A8T9CM74_9HELO|nr:putative MFS-type transporter [Lachnellula suecica]
MPEHMEDAKTVKTAYYTTQSEVLVLLPQPSDDPKDPLNWSPRRKYLTLFVLCFSCFAATSGPTSFQLSYVLQAPTYHETTIALSYSVTAAVAGLFGGPLLFGPFSQIFGRSAVIFWSLVIVFFCQIWAAEMTQSPDYLPFVISRWMAGMFAALPTILTPAYIVDLFFLHQRGRAFLCLEVSLLGAVIISPTLGGFIVQTQQWPVVFWWTLAPIGLAAILVFFVLEETSFSRDQIKVLSSEPRSFIQTRIATFLPGTKVVPSPTIRTVLKSAITPFLIGTAPITILAGLYAFVAFGFTIMINIVTTIILQTPSEFGGYGFSPLQNALFSFAAWMGVIFAQVVGYFLGDRIPLWASRRKGDIWQPEYRLWNMIFPAVFGPMGFGLFGAGVQYHLHYMVLALGVFFVIFSSTMSVPICLNYVVECFLNSANEVGIIMNCYRLAFAIGLGFFVFPWEVKVGQGWTFGMAACFDLFAALLIGILVWKGKSLRKYTLRGLLKSEEGASIVIRHTENEPESAPKNSFAEFNE